MTRMGKALFATLAISLAVWVFFRVSMPDTPLTQAETSFIVFAVLCAVLARGWLRRQVSRAWTALSRLVTHVRRRVRVIWSRCPVRRRRSK